MLSYNHLMEHGIMIVMHLLSSWMIRRYSKLTTRQTLIITIQDGYLQLLEEVILLSVITAIRIIAASLPFPIIITDQKKMMIRLMILLVTWEDLINSQ